MSILVRARLITPFALLTALLLSLSACGGGSSSAGGGGGSGGTIAGTVDNGIAAVHPSGEERAVLVALTEFVVARAEASGVAGVTVELLDSSGTVVATQTTGADGQFMFTGLAPGAYSIRLSQGGSVLGETPSVQVDSSTRTNIKLSLNGGVTSVEVEGEGDQISGEVESQSGDDNSNTQGDDNEDDDSVDHEGEDDHSQEDSSDDGNDHEDETKTEDEHGDGNDDSESGGDD